MSDTPSTTPSTTPSVTLYGVTITRDMVQDHCDELLRIARITNDDTRHEQYAAWLQTVPTAIFDSLLDIPEHALAGDSDWVAEVCRTWPDEFAP